MLNPIACPSNGYRGEPLVRVLEGIARAGFQYVELGAGPSRSPRIDVDSLTPGGLADIRRQLSSLGVMPISVAGHTDLAAPDGPELFKRRLGFAAAIGARIVNTGSGHTETAEEEGALRAKAFRYACQLVG